MYGIRYLRVFDYVSVSECPAGPARESQVYPSQPQMAKKPAHISLPYNHCLVTQQLYVKLTQQQPEAEMEATLSEGRDRFPSLEVMVDL